MLIVGIIAAGLFIVMFVLVIEKRGDPGYIERFYKLQKRVRRSPRGNSDSELK